MRKPRYAIYDPSTREYLQRVELPTGAPDVLHTEWTRKAAEALRLPGTKSARALAGRVGNSDNHILNARGERIA